MARHWFLGDMAAWAMALGADETSTDGQAGKRSLVIPSGSVTFWSANPGGTQYLDLLDAIDTPITEAVADSEDGEFQPIQGPDTAPETWYMWADGSGGAGPRRLVYATDMGDALNAINNTLADQAETIGVQQALIASSAGIIEYDTGTGSWPVRPSDSRFYFWLGPTAPPVGGGYMQDGRDMWANTSPAGS